ncbi:MULTISPECIES: mycofactocin biosynthesis peptidyl-dipeptidase MftE [unclassified Nocardioides]|uniref:mycofactocin biosynthesis peptidyl-dipeptidase MftE n=1 Tax=unclassified Nocardioides TaxID=2615069 RepID=UPI0006F6AB0A|nr:MULTISPECIES: mycofactocin biosynthesis peptidyl-dipeptidase MftE [unclassified Nocardioides]KQY50089.1 mycofactocin system creatininase [Nocardioides sp. Root140]KQZ75713.1 mycofactocin system creatininase [Nocardioides sp. Root151]KRF14785.1 mycofactocin system creatininase [Nocardioides sp. Soil796]
MTPLARAHWPTLAADCHVLVPIGSTEQHGPHLGMGTDTAIAVAVTDRLAARIGGTAYVAPPIAFGASGEHKGFPGLMSIGNEALELMLVELVRSMRDWAGEVTFVNAHGGNLTALTAAVARMRTEGHNVRWLPCATEEVDLHAGHVETSIMLHLDPAAVDMGAAEVGDTRALADVLPTLMAQGVIGVSANGVLGDPTTATAAEGERLLEQIVEKALRRLASGAVDERGCLVAGSRP